MRMRLKKANGKKSVIEQAEVDIFTEMFHNGDGKYLKACDSCLLQSFFPLLTAANTEFHYIEALR